MHKLKTIANELPSVIKYHLTGLLYGHKKPCTIYDGLTFKKLTVVYPVNKNHSDSLVKTWNVAVNTVEPEERFLTHDGWMLNILIEHTAVLNTISEREFHEMKQSINSNR